MVKQTIQGMSYNYMEGGGGLGAKSSPAYQLDHLAGAAVAGVEPGRNLCIAVAPALVAQDVEEMR